MATCSIHHQLGCTFFKPWFKLIISQVPTVCSFRVHWLGSYWQRCVLLKKYKLQKYFERKDHQDHQEDSPAQREADINNLLTTFPIKDLFQRGSAAASGWLTSSLKSRQRSSEKPLLSLTRMATVSQGYHQLMKYPSIRSTHIPKVPATAAMVRLK